MQPYWTLKISTWVFIRHKNGKVGLQKTCNNNVKLENLDINKNNLRIFINNDIKIQDL